MNLKLPTSIVSSLLLVIALAASAAAQQKRQTPARTQPQAAPTPVPTPPPTFDTLIAADTYRIYGEVRSVGQLIRSNSVNEILEPILKLAGPPKEFRTIVKWLNTHADDVISSRMLVATWPAKSDFPDAVIAIEFASPEEAAKFQVKLNPFLKTFLQDGTTPPDAKAEIRPTYHLQQAGSLILISPRPINLQKLRPAGSKWLSEDANFRIARNRLNTESVFIFVDVGAVEKEEAERERKAEEEYQKSMAERAANPQPTEPPRIELHTDPKEPEEIELLPEERAALEEQEKALEKPATGPPPHSKPLSPLDALTSLSMAMAMSGVEGKWPDAIGVGLSLEGDSFDLRALLINAPGTKSDAIPFLPMLSVGPPIVPEASSILPADSEMVVTLSLDVPQIYALFAEPRPLLQTQRPTNVNIEEGAALESPFAALERQLNIKIKDDVLPLIGSEIVVSVPMTGVDMFQPPKAAPPASASPTPSPSPIVITPSSPSRNGEVVGAVQDSASGPPPIVLGISLKDKEGMRAFLPKLIEKLAFKGASALAQTERREDTELVSYANMVSYAFIGNFLVISPDVKATRHVVDSYLKHETLAGDVHYKNYTRWQPRQVQGQIYISPSLMESYRTWIQQPNAQVDDQTRAFLTRFSVVAQPVTYSLSNEGFGPLHELHLPKNLVLLIIAATAGGINAPAPDSPSNPPTTQPPPPSRPY